MSHFPTQPVPLQVEGDRYAEPLPDHYTDHLELFCALNQSRPIPTWNEEDDSVFRTMYSPEFWKSLARSYPASLLERHWPGIETPVPWAIFGYQMYRQSYREMYEWALTGLCQYPFEFFIPPEDQLDRWCNVHYDTAFCIALPDTPPVAWLP